MELEAWLLRADERGNDSTNVDDLHPGRAWTAGNRARVWIDGAAYFRRLREVLEPLAPGDRVWFTDWRGDWDERLDGAGTEVGCVLAGLARRGVDVRGLVWRSHVDRMHFSERENLLLARVVNAAGGEVLLDERVRRVGSHHQKMVVVRPRDGGGTAFVGGIDLGHARRDDAEHHGDPQSITLDAHYGRRPRWHDVQIELTGPVVADVEATFRERWDDPLPLDHRAPWRARLRRIAREPRRVQPLPEPFAVPEPAGTHNVQLLRTYPAKTPPFPFAPEGERSVARGYLKALGRARALVYVEDQYLWSYHVAEALCAALKRSPQLRVIAVVPRYPDRDGRVSGPAYRVGQQSLLERVRRIGGPRVGVFDIETADGWPIYVHAKVCVVDDVWMTVGSDNLNRRSWTNDSELTCAVVDDERDDREPRDPAGLGDGARVLARDTRLRLWREHLQLDDDEEILDPIAGFECFRRRARALDAWHEDGRRGPRPPGRVRAHDVEPVTGLSRAAATAVYKWVVDPDGRPRALRRPDTF